MGEDLQERMDRNREICWLLEDLLKNIDIIRDRDFWHYTVEMLTEYRTREQELERKYLETVAAHDEMHPYFYLTHNDTIF